MSEGENRLYGDLAWLWPIWGGADGAYTRWCDHLLRLIRRHTTGEVGTLLDLGCGGGKNAWNLKREVAVTGVDLSRPMLDLAAKLNPECAFVQADMRTVRLARSFDSVYIDDAVTYMLSLNDLAAVFRTAYVHLRPGGVMVVSPDDSTDTFLQNRTFVSRAEGKPRPENLDVVYVENYFDPDPEDTTYEGTFVYLIREDGKLRVETDRHILGLFSLGDWRGALREAGFTVHEHDYEEAQIVPTTFACVRP